MTLGKWATLDNRHLTDIAGSDEGTDVTAAPRWHMLPLLHLSIISTAGDSSGPGFYASDPNHGG